MVTQQVKMLEIRDRSTFIAALAINMNEKTPDANGGWEEQRRLLRRCGYPCDGRPNIILTRLDGNARFAFNDPYMFNDRTFRTAHLYIIENWDLLKDGSVVDVEYILGETNEKKIPEHLELPPNFYRGEEI